MSPYLGLIIFFAVLIGGLGGIHALIWARLVRDTALPKPWKLAGGLATIGAVLSIVAAIFVSRWIAFETSRVLVLLPFIWLGLMVMLFPILAGVDLLRLALALGGKIFGLGAFLETRERRPKVARLVAMVACTVVGVFGISGLRGAFGPVATKEVDVVLSRLPEELSGFRIVQITDLHVGLTRGRAWVREITEQINGLDPDLIAITGDLVEGVPRRVRGEIEPLKALRATHGTVFVPGNHDHFSGMDEWVPELESLGITVLINKRMTITKKGQSFDLAGVDDPSASRAGGGQGPDLQAALKGRDPARELILLSHETRIIDEAAQSDVGLMLSGHTHGGQIWPWSWMVSLQQPYLSGLHRHGERAQIYVSEGTGCWGPPLRVGTKTEVTLIQLLSAAQ